jgi:hypothetical protein
MARTTTPNASHPVVVVVIFCLLAGSAECLVRQSESAGGGMSRPGARLRPTGDSDHVNPHGGIPR